MRDRNLIIRQASPADVNSIVAFQLEMAQETENRVLNPAVVDKGVASVLHDSGRGQYFIAELNGQVVGSLLITYEWSDWRNAYFWWIQSVYIDPTSRRRGIYSAMHNHILCMARSDRSVCGVRLYVDQMNKAGKATYSSLGMRKSRYDLYELPVDF